MCFYMTYEFTMQTPLDVMWEGSKEVMDVSNPKPNVTQCCLVSLRKVVFTELPDSRRGNAFLLAMTSKGQSTLSMVLFHQNISIQINYR
jgi:hypothetical protein